METSADYLINEALGAQLTCCEPTSAPYTLSSNARAAACHDIIPVPPHAPLLRGHADDVSCVGDIKPCNNRSIHIPKRNHAYDRFTDCDWESGNRAYFFMADKERMASERLRNNTWLIVNTTESKTRNRQMTNTKKLGDRAFEISFWKEVMITEVNAMNIENQNLVEHKRILEKSLAEIKISLAIAEECMRQRDKRSGVEEVHDEAEKKLSEEIQLLLCCIKTYTKLIHQASDQIRVNRRVQLDCDKDVQHKHQAQGIDDRMHQLRNTSYGVGPYPGIEKNFNSLTDCETWVKYSQETIDRSMQQRECSSKLRGRIDKYLRLFMDDLWHMYNAVTQALKNRVEAVRAAKEHMQDHLFRVNNEIRDMSRTIALLRKTIFDKEKPLFLAQTRLDQRSRRICLELCMDQANKGIICEIGELRETIVLLKENLRKAEIAMCRLLKTRSALQENIAAKENCIQVDERCILGRRTNMAMDPNIGEIIHVDLCKTKC